ncbi:hypothetical protein NPX13_g1070 [Xylaria arbuscula]|uniref:Aminoglycoside phosphotransferase domain-containing protein n=1 Tax=Xylaria arbuscula TaxID=114810 RepID=A0A9W8NNE3_9PEZI|nr:hypothetical protein NPX13_g1070 [Xylaria arbuscula]
MLILSGVVQDADSYDPAARAAEAEELTRLLKRIDTVALATRASALRNRIPCSIPPLYYGREKRSTVMGGMNYHIGIRFDDGVEWIARIRRFNATSPPPELRDYIIQSEVAALKFLEKTTVPAPRVFDFALESAENPVGVGYILMEKLPGKSLRWGYNVTQEQKVRMMGQLADIYIELRKYPFDSLGSLINPPNPKVGAFARESLTDFDQSIMRTLGPLSSWKQYHELSLQLTIDLIVRRELYSLQSVDAYLIHKFLLDLIPSILSKAVRDDDGRYYLKHADDKGDHLLVDEDYNITGIIDWEWAYTAPLSEAFNSPIGFLPVSQFYRGVNDLGEDEATFARLLREKGDPQLAQSVLTGRLQHRFNFCCGYDLSDWEGFLGLFKGLREAVGIDGELSWDDWKSVALERYRDDECLQLLLT